jgi:hypothetical protein
LEDLQMSNLAVPSFSHVRQRRQQGYTLAALFTVFFRSKNQSLFCLHSFKFNSLTFVFWEISDQITVCMHSPYSTAEQMCSVENVDAILAPWRVFDSFIYLIKFLIKINAWSWLDRKNRNFTYR